MSIIRRISNLGTKEDQAEKNRPNFTERNIQLVINVYYTAERCNEYYFQEASGLEINVMLKRSTDRSVIFVAVVYYFKYNTL